MEHDPTQQPDDITNPVPPMAPEPHHPTRRERDKRRNLILLIAGGVLALLVVLGLVYWLVFAGRNEDQTAQTTSSGQQQTEQTPAPTPADSTPVVYKSVKNNIELTHRKDWTLKEAATGEITITSPRTSYTRVDGRATTGVFTFKFRVGVPEAMQATIEKAVAPRDSEVIAYDDPPETQRLYTNLSYAGQKDAFNFFIVTGNTELKAGSAFAYMLVLDGEFYMLAGGFGTDKDNTLAFDAVAPSMIDSETAQQAIAIVKSLKIF